jgi:AraC family L-rhamnose operon regulatory protein RhaS
MKEIISYGRFQCTDLAPHKNRGMEITYVEKGLMEWVVEGVRETVRPGSIFFTLPWQVHGSLSPQEPDNTIWHVLFHLEEDYPRPRKQFRFPDTLGFQPEEMRTLSTVFSGSRQHCFRATPTIQNLMPELIRELQSAHDLREAQSVSLLRMILVELKRIVSGDAVNEETHNWSEQRVQTLLEELSSKCDEAWTLNEMAEQCGIKRTQLSNIFQKLTGGTPMEYLGRLRMERAKTLLRETDMKVIDIAFECGFGSSQYFANTFKQGTGMTPSAYRTHVAGLSEQELKNWSKISFRSDAEEWQRIQRFSKQ